LVNRLLSIADNLERALAHADSKDPLYAGVRLTFDDLMEQLKKEGVRPIPALGRSFDPNLHEAVATDGSGGNTVVKVLDTGYMLNGNLLRPARVVVGTYPS
jgi:molecular chaperone GrpE